MLSNSFFVMNAPAELEWLTLGSSFKLEPERCFFWVDSGLANIILGFKGLPVTNVS